MTLPERLALACRQLRVPRFTYASTYDVFVGLPAGRGATTVSAAGPPEGDPSHDLTLIDDDHLRLTWRVNRLKSRHAHREFPWSRTRRLVTNVRVLRAEGDELDVTASILVHRFRHGHADTFVGRYLTTLVRTPDGLRIRRRRAELDLERLSPNGALSMVF